MTTTITQESKNELTITNETRGHASDLTLADAEWTLAEAEGTLGTPHIHLIEESKNALNITNENKN